MLGISNSNNDSEHDFSNNNNNFLYKVSRLEGVVDPKVFRHTVVDLILHFKQMREHFTSFYQLLSLQRYKHNDRLAV